MTKVLVSFEMEIPDGFDLPTVKEFMFPPLCTKEQMKVKSTFDLVVRKGRPMRVIVEDINPETLKFKEIK